VVSLKVSGGFWSLINRRIVEEVEKICCGDGFVGDSVNRPIRDWVDLEVVYNCRGKNR
jgi:hypothetical protein